MADLDPKVLAILASAQAAENLLDAMSTLIVALQEKIDARGVLAIRNGTMDAALAQGLWYQKAAYAGILSELRARVASGRNIEKRQIAERELQS